MRNALRIGIRLGALAFVLASAAPLPRRALEAQASGPVGREAVEQLTYAPLAFDPTMPETRTLSNGVRVLFAQDGSLPLVQVYARFEGGYAHFPRSRYASVVALPFIVRNGGTATLPPDTVDQRLEFYAVQTTFGGGGEASSASFNVLKEDFEVALGLWGELLKNPGLDAARLEVWRGQQLEAVSRRRDNPTGMAFSAFNHLMYGDHPTGWEMEADDLSAENLSVERLRWIHQRVFCPDNLVLGVTGDLSWTEAERQLERWMVGWAPCSEPLPDLPTPEIRTGGGVFLIPRDLNQSTVVMAHASDIHRGDDPGYFASRVGNSILGASGLGSRLMMQVRTNRGYAYSASSLWTAPPRSRGLVGAVTQTQGERTIAATRLVLEVIESMRDEPPTDREVSTAVNEFANGFVFNFQSLGQIVSRQMTYLAEGLPPDWLDRFLRGLQGVSAEEVRDVFRAEVRPEEMVILILGDPERFDEPPESLGPVTIVTSSDPGPGSGEGG